MKDDLISRSALKDRFKLRIDWLEKDKHDDYTTGIWDGCLYDAELIDAAPTVDAVPVVHGRWCSDGERVFCSVCDQEAIEQEKPYGSTRFLTPRCPYCGARLDGGEADAES